MGSGLRRINDRTRAVITDSSYKISDVESGAYYGFTDSSGKWKIIKEDSDTFRYAFGSSDYATNWTGRAALTYTYYDGS